MSERRFFTVILFCGLALLAGWFMQQTPATSAQQDADTMRVLIEDLSVRGKAMTFTFVEPIAPNVTSRETSGDDVQAGDDYVCFSEAWNSGQRFRCTPYSNVISVTFLD